MRVESRPSSGLRRIRSDSFRARVVAALDVELPPTYEVPVGDWDPAEYPGAGAPAPLGDSESWTYLYGGTGGRWNPCSVVRWTYNPLGAYDGSFDDVRRALARVAGLTGLHFKYVGETTYVHLQLGTFPADADLAVAWSDRGQTPALAGPVAGLGGAYGADVEGEDVGFRIDHGWMLLDRESPLLHGYATAGDVTWGQVMVHEAMHAVGLGHTDDGEQVMGAYASPLNHRFGAGDLAGMTRIGAAGGCL